MKLPIPYPLLPKWRTGKDNTLYPIATGETRTRQYPIPYCHRKTRRRQYPIPYCHRKTRTRQYPIPYFHRGDERKRIPYTLLSQEDPHKSIPYTLLPQEDPHKTIPYTLLPQGRHAQDNSIYPIASGKPVQDNTLYSIATEESRTRQYPLPCCHRRYPNKIIPYTLLPQKRPGQVNRPGKKIFSRMIVACVIVLFFNNVTFCFYSHKTLTSACTE